MFEFEISAASANWRSWQALFEHQGISRENPLLTQSETFEKFVREYSVRRTIRKGMREALRSRLAHPEYELDAMVADNSGRGLDTHEAALRRDFGTTFGGRSIRSALSKIGAFLAPGTFVAWDKYARQGLNLTLGRGRSAPFYSYAHYLAEVNLLLANTLGDDIRRSCQGMYPSDYAAACDRFHRRVLDVHLMRVGGRDFNKSIAGRTELEAQGRIGAVRE